MQKYKFLIYLAVWKRPEITEICFMGISRLKRLFPVQAFAVLSPEDPYFTELVGLCNRYDIEYCTHQNQPLGAKKNHGLKQLQEKEFDYLVEIGSDDLLKNEYFNLFDLTEDRSVFALRDFVMIDSVTGACRRWSDRDAKFGLGRMIRRDALEGMKWKLWSELSTCGLDNNSTFALARAGYLERRVKSDEPLAIDIKSETNIWPFQEKGMSYPISKAFAGLSTEEVDAICSLKYATV
jgi:hypothetical protein